MYSVLVETQFAGKYHSSGQTLQPEVFNLLNEHHLLIGVLPPWLPFGCVYSIRRPRVLLAFAMFNNLYNIAVVSVSVMY